MSDDELISRLRRWEGDGHPHGLLHRDSKTRLESLLAERDALREALEPSGETKAAYMGEFKFSQGYFEDDGEECFHSTYVPWGTIKEIMAAIRARAALNRKG